MDNLNEQAIRLHLPTQLKDIGITVFDSIDSTNSYAKRTVTSAPALIVANSQTLGRGRLGKSFYSPAGSGIYMTLVIADPASPEYVTIAAAVAAARVIGRLSGKNVGIKWVNDIFAYGKKVSGILCEKTEDKVIIGIGINLTTAVFPDEISDIAGSLSVSCDRNAVVAELVAELMTVIKMPPEDITAEYKSHLFILGQSIRYTKDGEEKTAVAKDINEYGNLIVEQDGVTDVLSSGEITLKSKNFT